MVLTTKHSNIYSRVATAPSPWFRWSSNTRVYLFPSPERRRVFGVIPSVLINWSVNRDSSMSHIGAITYYVLFLVCVYWLPKACHCFLFLWSDNVYSEFSACTSSVLSFIQNAATRYFTSTSLLYRSLTDTIYSKLATLHIPYLFLFSKRKNGMYCYMENKVHILLSPFHIISRFDFFFLFKHL
jgi:hypothetical protein